MKNQSRQENLAYGVAWSLLFATPLLSLYLRTSNDPYLDFNWSEVFFVWGRFSIFLLLFLIHNFLLAPLLIHQNKRKLYASIMTALIAVFIVFQCTNRPNFGKREGFRPHKMEQREDFPPKFEEFDGFHQRDPRHEGEKMGRRHTPPLFVGEHDVLSIAVLLLMFGANLGTKYYFRSRRDQRKLEDLEKQNLEQQLEYLKYQINPHFFMNTLNNIHALVDIDPSKAQETIRELSKMMRFVLYEGDKSGVPLTKEFEFIRNYTKLMQLRYSDKVKITIDVPEEAPDVTIPPLMLISFIENAFKHGISYQHDSFIDIKLEISNSASNLLFTCRNSKAEKPNQEKGGVGLANVKKRLDLLYDKSYTLDIKDEPDIYIVELKIPLR
ncbi:MAG: histidine kinase [Prevotella ruminicola]|uniref:Histidine kinase n=1 Tax=Xylanibacter ruminicola TaxID=839 RepID=A0A928BTK7_XYLRU|nr:histidine kinase [Xylanibacter ruminicola]